MQFDSARLRAFAPLLTALSLAPLAAPALPRKQDASLRVVLVGSGPDLDYNQVAIESNVRYLNRLLPSDSSRTILFADGNVQSKTVLYEDDPRQLPVGEYLFEIAVKSRNERDKDLHGQYKAPNLGSRCDGANTPPTLRKVLDGIGAEAGTKTSPLFLYFTGHGSINPRSIDNNAYDMWGDKKFSVTDLASKLESLPPQIPVTLVMVQCHSGAFANLIFKGGNPDNEATDRDFAGFFAAIKENVAAGCTSELNEDDYRDFTSYFFAALTGRDRLGRKVPSADYNKDGRIGMDEAYCYTLANDRSIDVPVSTSDVFLRKYLPITGDAEGKLLEAKYRDVQSWATPAQKYALDHLSKEARYGGEDRIKRAYSEMRLGVAQNQRRSEFRRSPVERDYDTLQQDVKRTLLGRFPELNDPKSEDYSVAKKAAIAFLTQHRDDGPYKEIRAAYSALSKSFSESESKQIEDAHRLRLIRLAKSVLLAHRLRESRDEKTKTRYEKLVVSEGRTLLPPSSGWKN
ncbi:MAG: hypothetical protein H7308_14350 [Chthonomonadaceae bacterium]|nr:hypothetical protein [Chthonomonadaceae bacterium]